MTARRLVRAVVAGVLGVALVSTVGGGLAAAADGPSPFPLNVEVKGTTATSGGGPGGGSSSSGPASSTSVEDATEVNGSSGAAAESPEVEEDDTIDGILAVGGLRTSYRPSGNPFAGVMHVQVTVRNLSDEVIEPTVAFSLTNWLGMQLAESPERSLGKLAPDELRSTEVDLTGVGQWAFVAAHMTLTPPEEVGGVEVSPVTRDRWVLATPWFLLGLVAVAIGGVAVWRYSTRMPAVAAVGAAAGATT